MIRQTLRWLISSLLLLFMVTAMTFVLVSLAPGDAARSILSSQGGGYTDAQYLEMRHQLGVDQALPVQYWHWLNGLLHGSLGRDLFSGEPVTRVLADRIGPSLSITIGTVIVSGLLGISLGITSARRRGALGKSMDVASLVGLAVPNFWLGLVLVELFAVQLAVFPSGGYTDPSANLLDWLRGVALPIITLSAGAVAFVAKQTRDAMAEALSREFVTMLRARGVSTRSIVVKHALRNAAIPVVTVLGLLLVSLLSGTVLVESVFSVPGLGQEAVIASGSHNLPVITGVAFYFTVVVVLANLLVDLSYRWLNPKMRVS
jgi:peptide/nickel transport system permease protein